MREVRTYSDSKNNSYVGLSMILCRKKVTRHLPRAHVLCSGRGRCKKRKNRLTALCVQDTNFCLPCNLGVNGTYTALCTVRTLC